MKPFAGDRPDRPMMPPTRFNSAQLEMLEQRLAPDLLRWAMASPDIRSGTDNRVIRDMAALHAHNKVILARGRRADFDYAVKIKAPLDVLNSALHMHTPLERAGQAAGQLAIARTLTEWYDLSVGDFTRLSVSRDAFEFANRGAEGLDDAVCRAPQELGIVPYTTRDVYLAAYEASTTAILAEGPAALDQFLTFSAYPV